MTIPTVSARIIRNILEGRKQVAWEVEFIDSRKDCTVRLTIRREELTFPASPTIRGIECACIARLDLPLLVCKPIKKPARAKSVRWTSAHDAARDIARDHSADLDRLVDAIPAALEQLNSEWRDDQARIEARRRAARMLDLPHADKQNRQTDRALARFVATIENQYRDHSTVNRFEELANELATEFPELGFNSDDCAHEVWQLLRTTPAARPTRLGDATLRRAAELVATPQTDSIDFAEWRDEADLVPF